MSCRSELAELLPQYAAATLAGEERRAVEAHLALCPACREELALWREVGAAVTAESAALPTLPPRLVDAALARARRPRPGAVRRAWTLLWAQVPLVRREIWPASALVMALGYLLAVTNGTWNPTGVIAAIAPLVAAVGIAAIYGPENDPGLELALATPTSPRQVLLARLALVFGYDLLLALMASLGLLAGRPVLLLWTIILGWLAPMTFLSALALLLSLYVGTANATMVAFLLWLARGLALDAASESEAPSVAFRTWALMCERVWTDPALLLALSAALLTAAVWVAGRPGSQLARGA